MRKLFIPILSAIIAIATIVLVENTIWLSRLDAIERIDERISNVQDEINILAEKRKLLREEKIDAMSDYFNSRYKIDNTLKYSEKILNEMESWLLSKEWMKYELWAKWWWKIDCSWLFWAYAFYKKKIISRNTLINHYSAEDIRRQNVQKFWLVEWISAWDFLYIMVWKKATHIMYVLGVDKNIVTTYEANPDWVWHYQYRFISDWKGVFLERNWKLYDFFITTNNLLNPWEYLWDFLISSYIPKTNSMDINAWWKSWLHTASWRIVACPKQFSIGLNWEPKTKLYIEDYWIVECSDHGGLIVMKWEINSRWNVSSYNRLDLFAWLNTAKIKRGQQHRNVYLVK